MEDHFPQAGTPKKTPLNASTVLKAALRLIKVGPDAHFKNCYHFSPDENDEEGQIVLQAYIDPSKKDNNGRTNIERMEKGSAPLGPEGKSMNLHHLFQENGFLAELTSTTHQQFHGFLHYRVRPGSSHIDRRAFNRIRSRYWKKRASVLAQEKQSKRSLAF